MCPNQHGGARGKSGLPVSSGTEARVEASRSRSNNSKLKLPSLFCQCIRASACAPVSSTLKCLLRQVVVRDIYKERDIGRFTGSFTDIIEAHGVLALRLTPVRWVLCTPEAHSSVLLVYFACNLRLQL